MYTYAQILNGKVHLIMEHEANIETLYQQYFSKEMIFVDITSLSPKPEVGWTYDGSAFTDNSKATAIAALDAAYQPQFVALAQGAGLATLDGNEATLANIKEDYGVLKAEYKEKLEAINNG